MDKLEKALQKARAEREAALRQSAAKSPCAENTTHSPTVQIDESHLELYHILAHRTRSKEADLFRILRTQILKSMAQSNFKTLGITSANYGDGKTTVALNLALSIALDLKQTVLLVDLDLRKPDITDYLGIPARFGVSDYYMRGAPITDCLIRPSFERLTVFPGGTTLDNSSEVLGSPKIAALAQELRTRYADRIIIYDLPPTLAQDDPITFLPHVDAVLLVVNEGITSVSELKRCLNILSGAHVIGTVLNHSSTKKLHQIPVSNPLLVP